MKYGKLGLFLGGVLFGTAGIAALTSKEAKKIYTACTAAVLRGKDSVMDIAAIVKENCGDIYADALDLNDARYEAEEKAIVENARAIVEEYEADEEEE